MEDKFTAEAKDRVLLALLQNQSYTTCSDIALDIKDPRYNEQLVKNLLEEIEVSEYSSLIEIDKRDPWSASANEGVKDFLVNGGFIMINVKAQELLANQERKPLALQEEKPIVETRKVKIDHKPYWISGISVLIAISSLIYTVTRPSNSVSQEQYDAKIESIEKDLQQLRIDFKQENDELKDRLYKAEMLIAVYESEPK